MIHLTFFCVTWATDEPLSIFCPLSVRQLLRCFLNQSSRCPLLSRKRRRALRSWQRRPPLSSRLNQLSSLRAVGASGGATARRQRDPSCFLSSLILTPNVVKLRIEPSSMIQPMYSVSFHQLLSATPNNSRATAIFGSSEIVDLTNVESSP